MGTDPAGKHVALEPEHVGDCGDQILQKVILQFCNGNNGRHGKPLNQHRSADNVVARQQGIISWIKNHGLCTTTISFSNQWDVMGVLFLRQWQTQQNRVKDYLNYTLIMT